VAEVSSTDGGVTIWLTGLSGAGKTTTARQMIEDLRAAQIPAILLDGDELRDGLSSSLGFSVEDRAESVRRAGEIALVAARQGLVAIVSLVSPHEAPRQAVRARHDEARVRFFEVHVATPLAVCEERDPKDLYRQARAGKATAMTGVQQSYDEPSDPELRLSTADLTPAEASALVLAQVLAEAATSH
jgi:bifunctional enzyme CysN/CysC